MFFFLIISPKEVYKTTKTQNVTENEENFSQEKERDPKKSENGV